MLIPEDLGNIRRCAPSFLHVDERALCPRLLRSFGIDKLDVEISHPQAFRESKAPMAIYFSTIMYKRLTAAVLAMA